LQKFKIEFKDNTKMPHPLRSIMYRVSETIFLRVSGICK